MPCHHPSTWAGDLMGFADNEFQLGDSGTVISGPYGISWLAYVGPTLFVLLFSGLGGLLATYHLYSGLAVIAAALLGYGYHFLMLRSVRLYADEMGVWLFRGILPWAKGVSGVKWRDLDEAIFYQTFFGWLFKSYNLRIGHRFTRGSEILATRMFRGDAAVREINQYHMDLIRRGMIEEIPRQS